MADARISIIVFARRPRAGAVKRRLARSIGAAHAARLYAMLLERTIAEVEGLRGVRRILMPAAARDRRWFARRWQRRGWLVRSQSHGDLGRRMSRALARESRAGRAVVLLGSDIVDFTRHDVAAAGTLLSSGAQVVLGPAADGGYWMIGSAPKQDLRVLFTDVPWSTAGVLARTEAICHELDLAVARVGLRHDLDRGRDALLWRRRIQRSRACARSRLAT